MSGDWSIAIPPFIVSAAALVVPGLAVLIAGWGTRRLGILFTAPAVSTAIIAVAAIVAPWVGMTWSPLPVAILTVVAAAVAFALRRWVGADHHRPSVRSVIAGLGGLVLAGTIIVLQLTYVFVGPENISQTFDAIVHLNSVGYAVETANASAFNIGATSDVPFYPNAWHSLASLAATVGGVSVPVAVNAANLAICAIAWPASCIALASAFFGDRAAALVSAAALSTAFGAFPILLLYFGVLYPNTMAYAILPAGIAAAVWLIRATTTATRVRAAVLLAVVSAGIGLAHPNAFLALFAFGTFTVLAELLLAAVRKRSRRTWIVNGSIAAGLLLIGAVLWRFSRTPWEMSRWGPWQSAAQAFGEAALLSPRAYPITIAVSVLIVVGAIALARRPQHLVVAIPFLVAGFMFVLVSGLPVENLLREMVTNPWYNDPYRLAALLPVAGIPVATLGVLAIVDGASSLGRRMHVPSAAAATVAVIAAVALFAVGAGANVTSVAREARGAYVLDENAPLLSLDEARLIDRLGETVPEGALIAGSPWTGTSLAYALAGQPVLEKHVFGNRTPDELYLDTHLRDIDTDPRVCEAVQAAGVSYVLDFGTENMWRNPAASADRDGIQGLEPSDSLVLVDSEGPDARLFRIEGC